MNNYSKEHENYLKQVIRNKRKVTFTRLLILISIFVFWEVAGNIGLIDPFLTSTPSRMWKSLIKIYNEGTLFRHIIITCAETIVGFLLSTILGTIVAVLLWWSTFASDVLDPYLVVLNALPKIALAPIIIFWVGNGTKAIILVTLLICLVTTILGILNGFRAVDRDKVKLLETFGASKLQVLRHLIIPSNFPTIISILKINVGLSWVGVIMGEFLVAKDGLGFLIIFGGQVSQLDMVMMSIIILSVLAFFMYQVVAMLERRLTQSNKSKS